MEIKGDTHYLRRDVGHEGQALENVMMKTLDRKAALGFMNKTMKRHGRPQVHCDGSAAVLRRCT